MVGVGVAELSREDLFKGGGGVKSGVAVRMTEPAFDCPSLNEAAADGSFMLQVRRPQTSDFIIRTGPDTVRFGYFCLQIAFLA